MLYISHIYNNYSTKCKKKKGDLFSGVLTKSLKCECRIELNLRGKNSLYELDISIILNLICFI